MTAWKLPVLLGIAILALAAPANAAQVEKIASGLDNPRHLAFGDDDLYVAEAGRGGPGPCVGSPETGGRTCVGDTGAVTVIDDDGDQRRVATGLASLAEEGTGMFAEGPHGIFVKGDNRVYITNGGPGAHDRDQLAADNPVAELFGRVLRIARDGDFKSVADIWGFERNENLHPTAVDSNAVDVLVDRKRLIVADAGGNTILKVRKKGSVELLTVFDDRLVPNPFEPGQIPMESVPTAVVEGPDNDYFVSELTGFPFPVGGANVYRVDRKTGDAEIFAAGFTNIMDLEYDEHGTLWVLEIVHDGLLSDSTEGAIFAVDEDGTKTRLELPAGTLTGPGGITVGEDGHLYVTNNSIAAGGGEVLRISPDAGTPGGGEGEEEDDDANGGGQDGDRDEGDKDDDDDKKTKDKDDDDRQGKKKNDNKDRDHDDD